MPWTGIKPTAKHLQGWYLVEELRVDVNFIDNDINDWEKGLIKNVLILKAKLVDVSIHQICQHVLITFKTPLTLFLSPTKIENGVLISQTTRTFGAFSHQKILPTYKSSWIDEEFEEPKVSTKSLKRLKYWEVINQPDLYDSKDFLTVR